MGRRLQPQHLYSSIEKFYTMKGFNSGRLIKNLKGIIEGGFVPELPTHSIFCRII